MSPGSDLADLVPLVADSPSDSDELLRAADAFAEAGKNGAAILAAARAAGAGGAPDTLRTLVDRHAAPLAIGQRVEGFQQAIAVVETVKGFRADAAEVAAAVLDGVLAGGEPAFHLRALAQYLNHANANTVALELVRGAIALDPGPGWYQDTHALVLMSLARWDEAVKAIDRLSVSDPAQAAWARAYLGALTQPFDFWPASDPATEPKLGGVDPAPVRGVDEVVKAIRIAAGRVAGARTALVERVGEAPWLPPVTLVADAETPDQPAAAEDAVPALVLALRREWTRLTWLCYAAGLDEIVLPAEPLRGRPLEMVGVLLTVRSLALNDVADRRQPNLDDAAGRQIAKSTWGGVSIVGLAPHLARVALREQAAAQAAVRWMFKADADWPLPE